MALLRPQQIQPRLAEIARIYKGAPKGPKTPGKDLDHFRFEPNERTKDMVSPDHNGTLFDFLTRMWAELGESPRSVTIKFLHQTPDKIFRQCNEVWAKSGNVNRCVRRCNGEIQEKHLVEKNGKKYLSTDPIPCLANAGDNECPGKCKPTGMLMFIIPALKYPGQVVFTTHSINDILEIQGNLELYSGWDLSQIPFRLCRTKKTVSWQSEGELKSTDRWLCHLEIDPGFGNRLIEASQKQYLAQIEGATDVTFDSANCEILDDEPDAYVLPPAQDTRDWKAIISALGFTVDTLRETALANSLPASSKDLSTEQSEALFNAVMVRYGLLSGVYKAYQHCANSLAKLEESDDMARIEAWKAKIAAKAELAPGLE
jgi:hypothetical protein